MSYLRYDRTTLSNLTESLKLEHIRTNRLGGFSCSTLVGCNTRKYHGLLVVPLPRVSPGKHVLLSSLDATLVQHNTPFNLSVHLYKDGTVYPNGQKYNREFSIEAVPRTLYRVGGMIMERESVFCHYTNRLILKYTLLEAHSATTLQLRPLPAFREVQSLTYENSAIRKAVRSVAGGIALSLYDPYPELYIQISQGAEFITDGYWYKNLFYPKEEVRGYPATEDLFSPGYFTLPLEKDKPVYVSVSLSEEEPESLERLFAAELKHRTPRDSFEACLRHAARQFYFTPEAERYYLLSGYPWFGVRARDQLIALPGCTVSAGLSGMFHRFYRSFAPVIKAFMRQESLPYVQGLADPDVALWAVRALQLYLKEFPQDKNRNEYAAFVKLVVQYYKRNRHPHIRVMDNGLLYARSNGEPLTWMDAKENGKAVIPRRGYIVEVNALWYNALCFYRALLSEEETPPGQPATAPPELRNTNALPGPSDPNGTANELKELNAELLRIEASFRNVFMNEHGYLFDYVDSFAPRDYSVRPNMLWAVALPYSPLTRSEQRAILDIVTRELLTPKGLRTLSPRSEGYQSRCNGLQQAREHAYYNGSAWPYLLGAYVDAYLKINGQSGVAFLEKLLIGMQEEVHIHGISTISELYDGNPPYESHGAISFAMSVGEILRALQTLSRAKEKADFKAADYLYYRHEL